MEAAAWQRVKEVFHEAVDDAGQERDAFVRTACSDNPVVFNEVSELLASHDECEHDPAQSMSDAADATNVWPTGLR